MRENENENGENNHEDDTIDEEKKGRIKGNKRNKAIKIHRKAINGGSLTSTATSFFVFAVITESSAGIQSRTEILISDESIGSK